LCLGFSWLNIRINPKCNKTMLIGTPELPHIIIHKTVMKLSRRITTVKTQDVRYANIRNPLVIYATRWPSITWQHHVTASRDRRTEIRRKHNTLGPTIKFHFSSARVLRMLLIILGLQVRLPNRPRLPHRVTDRKTQICIIRPSLCVVKVS